MRNLLIAAIAVLTLSGCGANKFLVTEEKSVVVEPPAALFDCPETPEPPPPGSSQAEVADYVLRLYHSHQVCQEALEDVQRYLEQAKQITEQVQ